MPNPCWYCHHFSALEHGNAICRQGGGIHVRAMPQRGCAFFEREPGADDDAWWPAGMSRDPIGDWNAAITERSQANALRADREADAVKQARRVIVIAAARRRGDDEGEALPV